MGDSTTMSLTEVMDRLRSATDGSRMTVGDIFDAFGSRAYGPLIFVLGVVALSPVGSIPGASLVTGTLIMLLAAQMQLRAGSPWNSIRSRAMSSQLCRCGSSISSLTLASVL